MPSEIMEKTIPGPLGRNEAEQEAEAEPGQPADERNDRDGHAELGVDDGVHRVDRDEAAEPEIDRVAERQQARLPQQHVVGQGENDHRAHDAHHRQRGARREDLRRQREQRGQRQPRRERARGRASCFARSHQAGRPHDQHENEQDIGNDRREFRDGHLPEIAEERRRRRSRKSRRSE